MTPLTTAPSADWRLALVLVVLVAVAAVTAHVADLGVGREQVTAALRAVVQLTVVALVIAAVLKSLPASFAFVALMYSVASVTALRRIGAPPRELPGVAFSIAVGAFPVIALCLGSGVIPLNGAGVIPMSGILIGGAMTATTLAGRRAYDELAAQHGTYEAALAVGFPSPEAAYLVIQPTAREALTPALDQTRTVGLVTLPGAFVGVLLGGGTAVEAGAAQVLVLVGLLAVQAVTAACLLRLVSAGVVVRRELRATFPR